MIFGYLYVIIYYVKDQEKQVKSFYIFNLKNFIGNLISIKLENELDTSLPNLFNISRLLRNNQHKLNPNYFSDICGTTGLITFFLKDALEFLGSISNKNTCQVKILKNAAMLIEFLNEKIENQKKILEKIFNY